MSVQFYIWCCFAMSYPPWRRTVSSSGLLAITQAALPSGIKANATCSGPWTFMPQSKVPFTTLWNIKWHPRYGILVPALAAMTCGLLPALIVILYLTRFAAKPYKSVCQVKNDFINLDPWDEFSSSVPPRRTGQSSSQYVNSVLSHSALWSINLVFGNYSLSSAKAIHAGWDISVGRGGQALLGLAWYRVASNLVVTMAEESSVPHDFFTAVTISASNMWSFWHGIRILLSRQWVEHRHVVMAMVAATLWVIAWPTVMSLLTGYASLTEPFVKLRGGSLANAQEFQDSYDKNSVLIVHDGYRIGLYNDFLVSKKDNGDIYGAYTFCKSTHTCLPFS